MRKYDVLIIGGGVSGSALLYALSNFTDIKSIALLEKHKDVAQVSSHHTQNSQTLHFGDIESNYALEKATVVAPKARILQQYVETVGKADRAHIKKHKMLLAVGAQEVRALEKRYKDFRKLFPKNKLLRRDEIARIEPFIVKGRDEKEEIAAIWSPDGYIMDYYELSKSFVKHSKKPKVHFNTEVTRIEHTNGMYIVHTNKETLSCKVLVVDAGGMSIHFAKMLGYGKHLSIMSLGGNFYRGPQVLKGKVYTMQHPKRPNAAIHGDPDVSQEGYTRYGPTANILLELERYNSKTIIPYLKSVNWSPRGVLSVIKTGLDPAYGLYIIQNMFYDAPLFGKHMLNKEIRKIIPTMKARDIKKDKGYGAARPQIIDARTLKVNLGEARIEGEKVIFNITPSPGASTCLANAIKDAKQVTTWLGTKFDEKKLFKTIKYSK